MTIYFTDENDQKSVSSGDRRKSLFHIWEQPIFILFSPIYF